LSTGADAAHLRRAIELAHAARKRGNRPFGAVIVDAGGEVLAEAEADSTVTGDCTGHAETNALRRLAGRGIPRERMAGSTMYASGEPCVVYGVGHATLRGFRGTRDEQMELALTSRDVFRASPHPIEVIGPYLEDEASRPHEGFWKT
jgi:tRNA(adenine34) deaminase